MYYKILLILITIIISGCKSTTQDIFPTKTQISPKHKVYLTQNTKKTKYVLKSVPNESNKTSPLESAPNENNKTSPLESNMEQNNKFDPVASQSEIALGTYPKDRLDTRFEFDKENKSNQIDSSSNQSTNEKKSKKNNHVGENTKIKPNQQQIDKFVKKSTTNQSSNKPEFQQNQADRQRNKFESVTYQNQIESNSQQKVIVANQDTEAKSNIEKKWEPNTSQISAPSVDASSHVNNNQVDKQTLANESLQRVSDVSQKTLTKEEMIQEELRALAGSYEYVVYVEDELSGWQNMMVHVRDDGSVVMNSSIEFSFTALWIFTITYEHTCEEIWQNGRLQSVKTNTVKNGTKINLDLEKRSDKLVGTLDKNNISIDVPISTNNAWNLLTSFSHHNKYGVVNPEDGVLTYLNLFKANNQYMRIQNESILCSHLKSQGRDWEFWFHPKGFLAKQKDFLEGYKVEIILKKY